MPVRRTTDPKSLQHVWDAVRSANSQKQMADFQRITKYLQRIDNCTQTQAELYLKQSLEDGLILTLNKTTVKGVNVGAQVESYKIPNPELPLIIDDGKDWYCIDCHLAGDVISCRICHRVYHVECANKKQHTIKKMDRNFYLNAGHSATSNNSISREEGVAGRKENDSSVNNNVADNVENQLEKMQEICSNIDDPISVLMLEECKGEYDFSLCSICNMCKLEVKLTLDKEELNYLLSFVHSRIKTWLPTRITDTMSSEIKLEWLTDTEIAWRAKHLFYQPMSMTVIQNKIKMKDYRFLVQFKADVLTIQHNVAIYHGTESQEYGAAEYMLEDCRYDLAEISNCPDCYKHSNEKINNKWFCLPCRVPHKLVWAKQKGYPYWPAKVMKETDSNCDVRFFGGKYERSVLPKMYIKPIAMKMNDVQSKKSAAFTKAVDELTIHQKMLDNPTEAQLFITLSRKKSQNVNKLNKTVPTVTISSKSETSKKQSASFSLATDDDLFDKSAKALEACLTAQAHVVLKRKLSISPTPKVTAAKAPKTTMKTSTPIPTNKNKGTGKSSDDLINLSSDIEDLEEFPIDNKQYLSGRDGSNEEVTSSTEQVRSAEEQCSRDNSDGPVMPEPDRQFSESVEKTRRKLEQCHDKKQLIKISLECMQAEIDRINSNHDEYVKKLFEVHNTQVSETKKKQWCYNCEQEAIYHCCWNTAYCSPTCQQQHWQAEHKKVCRRKR